MNYDILNAADHPFRQQSCPLVIYDQLMIAFHSKSLSKNMQALGYRIDVQFLNLSHDEELDCYVRDVAVCRNNIPYIFARTKIPQNAYDYFQRAFSINNHFPLGYFLFYGKDNVRTHFEFSFSKQLPAWFLTYEARQFALIRRSRWQMSQHYYLELEEVLV